MLWIGIKREFEGFGRLFFVGNCCCCDMESSSDNSSFSVNGWLLVLADHSCCISTILHL